MTTKCYVCGMPGAWVNSLWSLFGIFCETCLDAYGEDDRRILIAAHAVEQAEDERRREQEYAARLAQREAELLQRHEAWVRHERAEEDRRNKYSLTCAWCHSEFRYHSPTKKYCLTNSRWGISDCERAARSARRLAKAQPKVEQPDPSAAVRRPFAVVRMSSAVDVELPVPVVELDAAPRDGSHMFKADIDRRAATMVARAAWSWNKAYRPRRYEGFGR